MCVAVCSCASRRRNFDNFVYLCSRCFCLQGNNMKALFFSLVLAAFASTTAYAGVAFFKYSYVDGMNRICVYDHLGSKYIITIPAAQICPVNINV